jgi:exopolysaccharide biosynthesis polyprenyl glycosylphosphotransferase
MRSLKRRFLLNCLPFSDMAVVTLAVGAGLILSGQLTHSGTLADFLAVRIKLVNFAFVIGFALLWHLVFRFFGLYRGRRVGILSSDWWDIIKAVSAGTLFLAGLAPILSLQAINRVFVITFFVVALVGTIALRTVLKAILGDARRSGHHSLRNLVIAGCGPRGAEFGKKVRNRPDFGYLFLGYIDEIPPPENPLHGGPEKILGPPIRTREILEEYNVDEVVITLPIASHYQTISEIISICEELAVDALVPSDFFQSRLVNVAVQDSRAWPAMELRSRVPSAGSLFFKRAIDLLASLAALIILSPLMAVIAIAIKLDSRGPVLFCQERVGLKRKIFKMHKFRTMSVDAEKRIKELEDQNEVNGAAFKMSNDPRVTRVGKILRKLSIDELPQFIDVFRGNMSLVGPRPLPIRDVERFDKSWQKRRFSVKPGLTCLWQINGRHKIDFEHWMELDLQYVDNWTLSMDLDILLKTVPAVLRGSGAS